MAKSQISLFTSLLLFLSIITSSSAFFFRSPSLVARQGTAVSCDEYSRIANLTVIGSNATYRAAYLAASPEGSDPARAPLDAAMPLLPALQFDAALNAQCGNLTTLAYEGAEANFTQGIVLQFTVNAAAQVGASALGFAALSALVVFMVTDFL